MNHNAPSPTATVDAVIAGGGIGGAVLAALLARAGKKVMVLEREARPVLAPNRAEILWPHTLALLNTLLPAAAWEESAMLPLREVRFAKGNEWLAVFDEEVMAAANVQPFVTQPMRVRETLLGLGGFEVRRGVKVTGLMRDGWQTKGVRFEENGDNGRWVAADWIIGDDGAHSVVRRDCGIGLQTEDFPIEFIGLPVSWPTTLPAGTVHLWLDWEHEPLGLSAAALFPFPRGEAMLLFLSRMGQTPDWAAVRRRDALLAALLPSDDRLLSLPRIRRPFGHAASYGAGNVALLGDAIHPVSPAGGQGANMAVADAAVLADCLLNEPPEGVIAAYEARRRDGNERSLGITRRAAALLHLPEWLPQTPVLKSVISLASRAVHGRAELLRFISGAFE